MAIGITQPLNLVVHDLGGPYGLAWAVKHPQKVKRLVIMNTVFFSDYRWHLLGKIWRTPIAGELFQLLTNRRGFSQELRRGSRKLTYDQINRAYDLISTEMKRMVLRLYRALDPNKFKGWEDKLLELTAAVPSLVLWGDHDPYIATRFAVEHFNESGHWIQAEEPEAVIDRMLSFFADESMPNKSLNSNARKLRAG
jgi:pimeloyl-ACP methyl ester carboxylesterase